MREVIAVDSRYFTGGSSRSRILVVGDRPIKPLECCYAFAYVRERISGPHGLMSPQQCVSCTIGPHTDPTPVLASFTRGGLRHFVAVVCVMRDPPRQVLEATFVGAHIFFEDAGNMQRLASVRSSAQ